MREGEVLKDCVYALLSRGGEGLALPDCAARVSGKGALDPAEGRGGLRNSRIRVDRPSERAKVRSSSCGMEGKHEEEKTKPKHTGVTTEKGEVGG